MSNDFEKFLKKILKTEQISPGDRLSEIISQLQTDELDEEQLEMIAAASKKLDLEKIKKLIEDIK